MELPRWCPACSVTRTGFRIGEEVLVHIERKEHNLKVGMRIPCMLNQNKQTILHETVLMACSVMLSLSFLPLAVLFYFLFPCSLVVSLSRTLILFIFYTRFFKIFWSWRIFWSVDSTKKVKICFRILLASNWVHRLLFTSQPTRNRYSPSLSSFVFEAAYSHHAKGLLGSSIAC